MPASLMLVRWLVKLKTAVFHPTTPANPTAPFLQPDHCFLSLIGSPHGRMATTK
ncbi:MAG: hypothetical protein GY796_15485 [Chloroflexi bacterium]|nr:hypothetical protein [Chloroflexota bacterium]